MAQRSYNQQCGVARAAEVLGERWAMLIVRDLLFGPKRYTEILAGLPGLSTNVLAARLRELEDSGVVSRDVVPRPGTGTVYALTPYGRELEPIVLCLGMWGSKTRDLDAPGEPRPDLAVLFLARRLSGLAGPLAVAVEFGESAHFTVLVDGHGETAVTRGSHNAPDVLLRTDVLGLWSLFDGSVRTDDLEQAGRLTVDGSPTTRRKVLSAITALDARA
jgi:DNA-binding HxlR family transcriptional regulator